MSDTLDPLATTSPAIPDPSSLSDTTILPKKRQSSNSKANNTTLPPEPSEKAQVILPQNSSHTKPALVAKPQKKPILSPAPTQKNDIQNVADWMDREYRGVSIYAVLMGVLLTLILWTGISTVRQIQAYHQQYTELQKTKKDYRKLQVEHQRLLIEQQTFSATPQIARRAVTELNMFYPKLSDRLIVQQPAPTNAPASSDAEVSP